MLSSGQVAAIRRRAKRGEAIKTIAGQCGVSRNTVRRYLRRPVLAGFQVRLASRRLNDSLREDARALFLGAAKHNATAVRGVLKERGVAVNVRTVQRVVADLRHVPPGERPRTWQVELAQRIARRMCPNDPTELEAELTVHLVHLQKKRSSKTRAWKAYLTTALRNKASDWFSKARPDAERFVSTDAADTPFPEHPNPSLPEDADEAGRLRRTRERLAQALAELSAEDRQTWRALLKARGKIGKAAQILNIHRNTLRKRIRRIRDVFIGYGLDPGSVQ